jgi:tetratricopeptide (TPR) repeat protein
MLSPRSFAEGYPWQDTLAHEITHLLVTTATRDNAPLWLQEALAKRFEIAWRPSRPLDGVPNQHFVTWTAWQQGRAIGVENLGASIALLPSPESARIAYAEVTDFLDFILRDSGWPALRLLLRELRDLGAERFNTALASVTGYTQEDWIRRWRAALSSEHETKKIANDSASGVPTEQAIDVARKMRLAELLASRNAWAAVDRTCSEDHVFEANQPDFHARAGLAKLQRGEPEQALELIGTGEQLVSLQGDWLALRGRALSELGRVPEAELHFNLALAFAPTDERVCCEGRSQFDTLAGGPSTVPTNPVRRPLCLAARGLAASAGHPPID